MLHPDAFQNLEGAKSNTQLVRCTVKLYIAAVASRVARGRSGRGS